MATGTEPPTRRRGRPPRISRERVIEAAYEIGIPNLTMAAVAQRLGTTHQALYNWVRDRDELLDLLTDLYVQRLDVPSGLDGDWRGSLRAFAIGLRALLQDIPGFASVGLAKFRTSEPFLILNERALEGLVAAGFDPATAQRIYLSFGTVLLGWIAREEAYDLLREDLEGIADRVATTVAASDGRLSLVAEVTISELAAPAEERFAFLVDTFLGGLPDPVASGPTLRGPAASDAQAP